MRYAWTLVGLLCIGAYIYLIWTNRPVDTSLFVLALVAFHRSDFLAHEADHKRGKAG
jgi:hypothetical protein